MARKPAKKAGKPAAGQAARQPADLAAYRAKRRFGRTPEPSGAAASAARDGEPIFVVQKHAATRLHYDLRLQIGDVMTSWAVAKGPSLDPAVKRLAVQTENHPLDYAGFEGVIPKGEYGGGTVMVWDRGTWAPMGDPARGLDDGLLKFRLDGEKLAGGFSLVRLKSGTGKDWLLVKDRDIYASADGDVLEDRPESVLSGLTIEQLGKPAPVAKTSEPPRPDKVAGARRAGLDPAPKPQLATAVKAPPFGPGWLHEIKYDGYRMLAVVDGGEVTMLTRNGHDWTERMPELAAALAGLPCGQAILDGEAVVQDEAGVTRFEMLLQALRRERDARPMLYYAFDILHLDGVDLTGAMLLDRKAVLQALLGNWRDRPASVQYSDHVVGHGAEFFAQAAGHGLEGIISKKADAPYAAGRTQTWTKTKSAVPGRFAIVGFAETEAAGGLAALLLAEPGEKNKLSYVGRVGTGWSRAAAAELLAALRKLKRKTCPLPAGQPRDVRADETVTWVTPSLEAEIRYTGRTADNAIRHGVFQHLAGDQPDPPDAAKAAQPAKPRAKRITSADLAQVWITNPDRHMFTRDGPTKLDLALYYARVADWLLPEVENRPLSLVRCPGGKVEDCFFQRHRMTGMPGSIRTVELRDDDKTDKGERRGDFLYLNDARGLLDLAQFGVVEFHPWGCRVDSPEKPDRLILDLDPDESLDWREVVDAARDLRDDLAELGLTAFVKTTGGKGLHLVVAVERRTTWAGLKGFAQAFADRAARQAPRRFTANAQKAARRGRIYVDYLRNGRGATAVSAYSLRARPGVPVATPLAWDELAALDDPRELDVFTVPERLQSLAVDPWDGLAGSAVTLTKQMRARLGARG